jgi:hypothetical protein
MLSPSGTQHCFTSPSLRPVTTVSLTYSELVVESRREAHLVMSVVEGPWRLKPVGGFIQLPSVSPACFAASLPDSQDFATVHVVCTSISHVVGMQEPVPWTN